MPKASPIISALNAGELSPLLGGRVDIQKYASGFHELLNFVPTVQGPVKRRGGTRYASALNEGSTKRTWLVPFVVSNSASYMLAWRDGSVTIYGDNSTSIEALTEIQTITSPYSAANLTRADGTFGLAYAQSGDVMYVTHPTVGIRKITRTGPSTFTLTTPTLKGGPWKPSNADESVTIVSSGVTGSVTLTASGANVFTSAPGMAVGQLLRLEQKDLAAIKPWEPGQKTPHLDAGVRRRSDGKTYLIGTLGAGTTPTGGTTLKFIQTGSVRPVHTNGKAWDGDQTGTILSGGDWYSTGVEWEFEDPGYGVLRIDSITNGTTATATVLSRLPAQLTTVPTWRWEMGAINATDGYPEVVTFFRERLVFAKGTKLWASVAGDFENFEDQEFGEVLSDSAITIDVLDEQANPIVWVAPSAGLLIGTEGGELVAREVTANDPFGPDNVKVDPQSRYGARKVQPVRIGGSTMFVQQGGRKVREIAYAFENDNFVASDMTALSEHITRSGVAQMAFALEPDSVIWCARNDGVLLGCTYNKEQDVLAWHPHSVDGVVESIAVIPATALSRQVLWMAVRRTVNGGTVRYLEALTPGFEDTSLREDAFFVDSGKTIKNPSPSTAATGFAHLEGRTVAVLADGAVHPNRVVTGGGFTLDRAVTTVHAGIPMTSRLQTMRLEAGAADGTAQGKRKKVSGVTLRVHLSLGGKLGPDPQHLDEVVTRTGSMPMDAPPTYTSGDYARKTWQGGWEREGRVCVQQDQPLPLTVVAIMADVNTTD